MEYHMSVTRVATQRDLDEAGCKRAICTEAVKRTLATMLDYKLLKSPTFLLITLNATFVCLGYFTTYIFIEDRARQAGLPKEVASWLIPIIGIANITGRIICGFIATCPRVSCTGLSALCLSVGGLATVLSAHFDDVVAQVCYAVIFGSFIGKKCRYKQTFLYRM
uniref:Monocarboxylate transporter 4 n=1 Tax=Anoplophora glabripennis TaxID=217634 RepID=V5GKE0_ANOGL